MKLDEAIEKKDPAYPYLLAGLTQKKNFIDRATLAMIDANMDLLKKGDSSPIDLSIIPD